MKRSLLIATILIMLMGQMAYAGSLSDLQGKIDIISPAFGSEGEVVLANDLYISIRINQPIDRTIKVVKVEEFEVDMDILDKAFLNVDLTDEEKGQIYNANIARNYYQLRDQVFEMQEDMNQQSLIEIDGEAIPVVTQPEGYEELMEQYAFYERAYQDIFRRVVLEPEPLTYEGILPYYERTIPILGGGDYKMVFSSPEGDDVELDFTVVTRESVAQEIIDSIPLRMIKLIDYFE